MVFTVRQQKFEGPLELLLELIQKQELSINEISLAKVTDEFIGYLKALEKQGEADPELLAEFLVVAAQLLLIKSRSLLPQFEMSPEEEESVHELEQRLAEYQRLKELSSELGHLAQGGQKSFSREAYAGERPVFYPPKNVTGATLTAVFQAVIDAIPKLEKLAEEKIGKIISLEEKMKELQLFLQQKVERVFSELIAGAEEKMEIIVSFLAILELAKQRLVKLHQAKPFQEIIIRRQ